MTRTVACVILSLALMPLQARTDFSGTWIYDSSSFTDAGRGRGTALAKLLGDEVTITQTDKEMRLVIRLSGATIPAVYAIDGSESRNLSSERGKPDVTVTSKASWEDGKLIVRSTSASDVNGATVTTETKRVFWIDAAGNLVLERSGTPVSEVPATRSVYRRKL
jgi:hypothetical protein